MREDYGGIVVKVKGKLFNVKVTRYCYYTGQCMELPAAISQAESISDLNAMMKDAIKLVLNHK